MVAPDQTSVSRLVLRAPNWLGDAILALPAMAALRRHFADAKLTVAAVPGVAPIFREDTDVRPDQVIEVSLRARVTAATLEGGGFDLGVLFPNSFKSALTLRLARVPERWGYPTALRGWLLTRASRPERAHGVSHHADYFRRLVRGLGVPVGDELPRVGVSADTQARADALLVQTGVEPGAKLVGFAPGAAYGEAKRWLPDRVAAVAARLARERDATCVMVGAPHDRATAREIESWIRANAPDVAPRIVDLIGRTSLAALAGVTRRCRVFVSNDSGAMHLASALGLPVVAMFGPTDERSTRPSGAHALITARAFCRPCLLRDCPIDHRCMKRISTDTVFAAVSKQLAFQPAHD